ncbi:Folate transporter 1 isoform 1 [Hibiscus syriacus]|uniref:Folate transporter 1 isoform 1 n=1 Tax=Hibiscus syriacus TaxID=106335 RepID=A0A6A3ATW3_HIBSY|nr:Folate transporter 1 isoform 1 [Hibiscus syriacus]
MLTTRNKEVALYANAGGIPHEPMILAEDESLKLFCKKAFHGMNTFPPELKKFGRDMVVRCGGLPLAVGREEIFLKFIMETRQSHQNLSQQSPEGMQSILAMIKEELPISTGNLQNLQTLDLRYSCFLKRIPNVIWKMVQLRHLLLYTPFDSPDNEHLRMDTICNLQSFPYIEAGNWIHNGGLANMTSLRSPKLEILRLHLLKELEDWIVEESAMPKLKHLVINRCEKLKRIPDGLKLATTLKELEIVGMPVEFEYILRTKDFFEFQHTPSIKSITDMLAIGLGSHQNVGWPEA